MPVCAMVVHDPSLSLLSHLITVPVWPERVSVPVDWLRSISVSSPETTPPTGNGVTVMTALPDTVPAFPNRSSTLTRV